MADNAPRPRSGPPKLRSSCDRCGAQKLKCDRGQPECTRCVSHGVACVYGVSRKMGKPPRDKSRTHVPPRARSLEMNQQRQQDQQQHVPEQDVDGNETGGTTTNNSSGGGTSPNMLADGGAWDMDTVNGNDMTLGMDMDMGLMEGLLRNLPESNRFSLSDVPGLDFIEWPMMNTHDNTLVPDSLASSTPETLDEATTQSYPSPRAPTAAAPTHPRRESSISAVVPASHGSHDCALELCEILKSLSSLNLGGAPTSTSTASPSGSTSASVMTSSCVVGGPGTVPLDHVLRQNRVASERLGRLLGCGCARSPPLTLLYASVISRVLDWYQQAADCTPSPSWGASPAASTPLDSIFDKEVSHHCSSAPSSAASMAGSVASSSGLAVEPVRVAIGSFDVDDSRLQCALKMQLLSGEVRRAGRLIEQLSTHYPRAFRFHDRFPQGAGGTDGLHQSLDSWLRAEHLRVANLMRSRLKELNN